MTPVFLVGVDCSECSERALEYAANRARAHNARLLVAHVIEWSQFTFSTPQENEERHKRREEELQRAHAEVVDPIVEKLCASGVKAEALVRHGHVADTLNRLAGEEGATNIIVGRHGSSRLKAQVFGSVASSIVQIADCPVTVVP